MSDVRSGRITSYKVSTSHDGRLVLGFGSDPVTLSSYTQSDLMLNSVCSDEPLLTTGEEQAQPLDEAKQ
jgi:hypothetical protein